MFCCYRKGIDDINHILITGNFANHIWKYYAPTFGITQINIDLRSLLLQWTNLSSSNQVHKLLISILPNFICLHLWKNRCAVKYGNKISSIQRVQYGIFKDIMQTIKVVFPNIPWQHSCYSLINLVEQCQQQLRVIMVNWRKPQEGIYKLNTDGSALPVSGKIGGGGILRDHKGYIMHFQFLLV